jgi:hypothetical protein
LENPSISVADQTANIPISKFIHAFKRPGSEETGVTGEDHLIQLWLRLDVVKYRIET